MGAQRARPVVLDAGALIAVERNDRRVRRLVELAVEHGSPLHVPAGVVGQPGKFTFGHSLCYP